MTTQNLTLFQLMTTKMRYAEQQKAVYAQNIANADTPGYVPQKLVEPNFRDVLKGTTSQRSLSSAAAGPVRTDAKHMASGVGSPAAAKSKSQSKVYETAPAGNKVILEEQLLMANQAQMEHQMTLNIYQKYRDMLRAATGDN